MRYSLIVRLLLATALSLGLATFLVVLLHLTDLGLRVWEQLSTLPDWLLVAYTALLFSAVAAGGWLVWMLLRPARTGGKAVRRSQADQPINEEQLQGRLEQARDAGFDIREAEEELAELRRRREVGEVHVAFFGTVSTGKSTTIGALLPEAREEQSPRAGTTRAVERHVWTSPAGDRLVLTDLPGLNEPDGELDELSREEAERSHIVIFLVDGDLTRDQFATLTHLLELKKPLILALNKSDLYTDAELESIRKRLRERIDSSGRRRRDTAAPPVQVVSISAAANREIWRLLPNGSEERTNAPAGPDIHQLRDALQALLDSGLERLERLRDANMFSLTAGKLDRSLATQRLEKADSIIARYTRRAVMGAVAAVSPGTDVLIQGYLGVQMVKSLCSLYEVPVREVDVDDFLRLATKRVGRLLPITLAVSGNALKAFPGLGTLGGGALHAIAYGLLFDSLGRAVVATLSTRGTLSTGPALRGFEEQIADDLESRARRLARLALEAKAPGSEH